MRQRAKYGINAPRVVRAYIITGVLLTSPALKELAWPGSSFFPAPWRTGAAVFGALLLAWSAVMLRSSVVGKMRIPFSDAAFDAVISMTVIHNIPSQESRDQAIREIIRVLKPGGRIAIFDLMHTARYAEILRQAGLTVESLGFDLLWLWPCRSFLARKPEAGFQAILRLSGREVSPW